MTKSGWMWGWGVLLGLLQVLVLLLLLEEYRRHLGLQDPRTEEEKLRGYMNRPPANR
jgi:hypothetical protein